MQRLFPRFLFSNPQNTKSKGPFIVHTLEPRIILRVEAHQQFGFICIPLEEGLDQYKLAEVTKAAQDWFSRQIASGEICFPGPWKNLETDTPPDHDLVLVEDDRHRFTISRYVSNDFPNDGIRWMKIPT